MKKLFAMALAIFIAWNLQVGAAEPTPHALVFEGRIARVAQEPTPTPRPQYGPGGCGAFGC